MSCIIRTQLLSASLCLLTCSLLAGGGSPKPVSLFPTNFFHSVKQVGTTFRLEDLESKSRARICSCQIMSMESRNYRHDNVAVFAEKISTGNPSSGFGITNEVIEKEKKHLRLMFYDKMKVVYRTSETTDCRSLFSRLKETNSSLVLYEILDADVRK